MIRRHFSIFAMTLSSTSENGEHSNAACVREELNPNLSSSDTSNTSSEPYVIWTDYDDPTTTEFMLQPGIHVPSSMKDTPNFNNIMGMGNMQFLQQHQDTSSHFTFDNDDVKLSDENEEESEPDQTRISPMHDSTSWPKFARPTLDEVLRLDNNDDKLNDENGNEEGSNPNQTGNIPMPDSTRWQTFDRPTRDEVLRLDNNDDELIDENEEESNTNQEFDSPDHMYLPPFPDNVSFQSSS
ncbi:Hypothetical predicted protein, partial [Mytilus galloprovincialis]